MSVVLNSENLSIVRPSTLEFQKIGARIGVEVGCAFGANAYTILTTLPEVELYGVDNNAINYNGDLAANLAQFAGRFVLLNMDSVNGALKFADESLDFVYIDADHKYASVLMDISTWYPKVRKGGIVAGHDFEKLGRTDGEDVQNAVLFFAKDKKLQIHAASIIDEPGENGYYRMDWWFYKE
jgi:predicted O-methyltransferase YrrM